MTNKELQDAILYQDSSYLIASKPAGISAQDDLAEGISFHKMLEKFASKKLFLVHRLDRPTSGIMLFAKKAKVAAHYSQLLSKQRSGKKYLAAVQKPPEKESGNFSHYLFHDKKLKKSFVSKKDNKKAKLASLDYKVISQIDNYTLLEITLRSGRFHQIRSQLAAEGSPIKGDVKYGARRGNKDRSINLHAYELEFPTFYDNEIIKVNAAVPNEPVWQAFVNLLPEIGENKDDKWKVEQT